MTHDNTGGPAFPQHSVKLSPDGVTLHEVVQGGMTLRDWFAGQALAGILASGGADAWQKDAENAYTAADAMLAAREAKP